MKKVYIAGCGGMLGEAFYHSFKGDYTLKCSDIDLNEDWIQYLDFRDLASYEQQVRDFSPDYLIHLGAHTDLEYCERNIEDTYATNTIAVENAVLIANKLNIPVIYISTAGIFDGQLHSYDDWAEPNPLGHYARSKFAGERYVVENASRYLVCRAGWMMGGGPKKDKKFISKLINQIEAGKKEIHIVNDKFGTPTYTHDFARNMKKLMENETWGLYNMVCGGLTSRLEVAKEVLTLLNKTNEIKLIEVDSSFFSQEYFAPRPANEQLINRKLDLRKMNLMRDWKVALKDYIKDYFDHLL